MIQTECCTCTLAVRPMTSTSFPLEKVLSCETLSFVPCTVKNDSWPLNVCFLKGRVSHIYNTTAFVYVKLYIYIYIMAMKFLPERTGNSSSMHMKKCKGNQREQENKRITLRTWKTWKLSALTEHSFRSSCFSAERKKEAPFWGNNRHE